MKYTARIVSNARFEADSRDSAQRIANEIAAEIMRHCESGEVTHLVTETFVPSQWNLEVFQNSGVERVDYLPLFVDDSIFKYKPKSNLEKFTFFAGACTLQLY